jgi:hypothetical protein
MAVDQLAQDNVRDARARLARHLAEMQRTQMALASESRSWKAFTTNGHATAEIELAWEMLENYLAMSDAFLENMRGRLDARLSLLRRGEPVLNGHAELAPGHASFWLDFSRLQAVLRRIGARLD